MANLQDLEKNIAVVHCISPLDNAGAVKTGDYIHMKNYDAVTFVCMVGEMDDDVNFTVQQCTQDADAGADAKACTNAKTCLFTNGTDENTTQVLTVNVATDMDVDGGFEWLELETDDAASTSMVSAVALCYRARYAGATMPSATT